MPTLHGDVRGITNQMYLKQIFLQHAERPPVTLATLARSLGVAAPSVVSIIRRMEQEGMVKRGPAGAILLSKTGQAEACKIVRRHNLAERFLVDTLKLGWSAAHDEACRLEHAITTQVEEALDRVLGHPETCPHGNRVDCLTAGCETVPVSLAKLAPGVEAVVCRIGELGEQEPGLLELLDQLQIVPGARVTVVKRLSTIDTLEVEIGGRRATFGQSAALHVYCQTL